MATTSSNPFDLSSVSKVDTPSSGILGSQMQQVQAPNTAQSVAQTTSQGYDPTKASSQGYTAARMKATDWQVTPNQTVQGQLSSVLDSGSPLLTKARADTAQAANARGLLNSSMAAGAGEAAVLDKALQIATPDAQVNAQAGQFNANARNAEAAQNQQATNTASQFTAGAANTAELNNQQAANRASEFTAGAANNASATNAAATNAAVSETAKMQLQAGLANQQQAFQSAMTQYDTSFKAALANADATNKSLLTQLDGAIKTNLATIEAQFKTQMQTSQSAAAMYSETIKSIGQIMQDQNLDAGAKQNAIDQQMAALQNSLKLQAAITNIPGLTDLIGNLGAQVTTAGGAQAPAPDNRSFLPPVNNPNVPQFTI